MAHKQDIDKELSLPKRVWIFHGNPQKHEVYNSLIDEKLKEDTWLVSRYQSEIRIGDIALIWKAGQGSGIYAVGEVLTNPQLMYDPPESRMYWKSEADKNKKAVRVLISYKLKLRLTNALFRKELGVISGLRNMEILKQPQGTNFRVNPSEWLIICDLLKRKYNFVI